MRVPGQSLGRWRRRVKLAVIFILLAALSLLALFAINGLLLASGERPLIGKTPHPPAPPRAEGDEIRIVAYNIAKCFFAKSRLELREPAFIERQLAALAAAINREQPDFVFLSEAIFECTPSDVNQVVRLAELTHMHSWAFGENYNVGIPGCRVSGGNAILSRHELEPMANPPLAGRRPFYVTKNNRRVLWCASKIGGRRVQLASIHNDSQDAGNNARQLGQILDYCRGSDAILAGDFNALPGSAALHALGASERFTEVSESPLTFPADAPARRIDFVFAPKSWLLLEQNAPATEASDHRPVVYRFRCRW